MGNKVCPDIDVTAKIKVNREDTGQYVDIVSFKSSNVITNLLYWCRRISLTSSLYFKLY